MTYFFMTLGLRSCCTFALRVETTLKLRFAFLRHCDIFLITSQLRYLFARCTYVFKMLELHWYIRISYRNDVIITFRFWFFSAS